MLSDYKVSLHCSFLQPNTLRADITLSHMISHESRFYASSTLRETCYGVLETFVTNDSPNEATHMVASRDLLQRLLNRYHAAYCGCRTGIL